MTTHRIIVLLLVFSGLGAVLMSGQPARSLVPQPPASPTSLYDYLPRDAVLVAHLDLNQLWNHAQYRQWRQDNFALHERINKELDKQLGLS
ncbi:MAG: hypothetical protein RMJ88_00975, partial [Thermogemmata sp.]|nr:hypothetical protein [Thermogemmata sp.]